MTQQHPIRRKSFYSLFLTLLLVILIPLSLLVVYFIVSSTTIVRKDYIILGQQHADTVRGTLDTYLNARLNLVYDMSSNRTIRKLAANMHITDTELRDDCVHVAAVLRAMQTDDSVFSLAALYLPGRNLVIHPTNAHMDPDAFYQQHVQLFGLTSDDFFREVCSLSVNRFYPATASQAFRGYSSHMIVFIQPMFLNYLSHRAYFVSMISADAFSRLVLRSFDSNTRFRILDADNRELLRSPGFPQLQDVVHGEDSAGKVLRYNGVAYCTFYSAGHPTQLQYLFLVPESSVMRQLGQFISFWFAVLALCLGLGIIIARHIARRVSTPIYSLLDEAFPDGISASVHTIRDEVALVADKMREDEYRFQQAKQELQAHYQAMRDTMLSRLLTQSEHMSPEDLHEFAELVGIPSHRVEYRVLVIENDEPQNNLPPIKNVDLSCCMLFTIQQSPHRWLVLLVCQASDTDQAMQAMMNALAALPPATRVGISRQYGNIHKLQTCLQEAFAANRKHDPDNDSHLFYDDLLAEPENFYYPPEQELLLLTMVKTGQHLEVEALLSNILRKNREELALSPETLENLYSRMITTLRQACQPHATDFPSQLVECLDILNHWQESRTPGTDVLAHILQGFTLLCEVTHKANQSKNRLVIDNVIHFLETHYTDQALCLDMVADHLGVSYFFLSRIFREETNRSFSDLLNDIRIGHAVDLLIKTDLSVQNVGNNVGYTNWSTFLRAFRKRTDTTPLQYRRDASTNTENNEWEESL